MVKHKSGAQKRKERAARQRQSIGQQTLDSFGIIRAIGTKNANDINQSSASSPASNVNEYGASDDSRAPNSTNDIQDAELSAPNLSPSETESIPVADVSYRDADDESISVSASRLPSSTTSNQPASEARAPSANMTFDIGLMITEFPSPQKIRDVIQQGHQKHPDNFPSDSKNRTFPTSLLSITLANGEKVPRDWLVWSRSQQALYCLPCRLFSKASMSTRSNFAKTYGYDKAKKWKKLFDKIPEHQNSCQHKVCYLEWRAVEKRIFSQSKINDYLF